VSSNGKDVAVLRELARAYAEVCAKPCQDERRDLWRNHNSLRRTRIPVLVRGGAAWGEIPEVSRRDCQDPFYRPYERQLRLGIYRDRFGDDFIAEPWITVPAVHRCTGWGVKVERTYAAEPLGSWKTDYPIKSLDDAARLRAPRHEIDEPATARAAERVGEAVGDLLTVNVDRAPAYRVWSADLSTDLGYLRGIEHFMLDMVDHPAWLHELLGFMSAGVLRTHEQAEAAGDWGLGDHENQAMPYARELRDPAPNVRGVRRKDLWYYAAAQECTLISPAMHEEFILRHQRPILEAFGLVAYGCCEDLTNKIGILRTIPNLRRIAVAPRADVRRCAEQIGTDYVISWRPNPAETVCCGFDPARIRRLTAEAMDACRGLHVDITLKDIRTVQGRPERLVEWVRVTRDVADRYA